MCVCVCIYLNKLKKLTNRMSRYSGVQKRQTHTHKKKTLTHTHMVACTQVCVLSLLFPTCDIELKTDLIDTR